MKPHFLVWFIPIALSLCFSSFAEGEDLFRKRTRVAAISLIWASYQRTMQIAREGNLERWHQPYRTYLETTLACRDFEEYARTQWITDSDFNIKRGGFWQMYCCDWDGTPLPVTILRFDNLAADWRALVRDWGLPRMAMSRVNASGLAFERGLVADWIYGDIMSYCWADCERFAYE